MNCLLVENKKCFWEAIVNSLKHDEKVVEVENFSPKVKRTLTYYDQS